MQYKIGILGAGSIGCYVGGLLCHAGCNVIFFGRKAIGNKIQHSGLTLSALDRAEINIDGNNIDWGRKIEQLGQCDIVIVSTKSGDTGDCGKLIDVHCGARTPIISMQNGVGNAEVLEQHVGARPVLSAMVSFNVVRMSGPHAHFHRGSEGEIIFPKHETTDWLAAKLVAGGIKSWSVADIKPVLWGKLLMNLNNAINVLSGLPLKQQLQTRAYRLLLAESVEEALGVLKAAGIVPARIGKVPPKLMPFLLRLPDIVFNVLARKMLDIDEDARSSMWEDLQHARQPEIQYLNGAICNLGRKTGSPTVVNNAIIGLVEALFSQKNPKHLSAAEIAKSFST